jgi:hypothetical protein
VLVHEGEVTAVGAADLWERADVELAVVAAGAWSGPELVAAAEGLVRRQAAGDGAGHAVAGGAAAAGRAERAVESFARTVMSLMGWSSAEMAARYQHVTDTIRQDVARQVDTLIWRVRGDLDAGGGAAPRGTGGAAREAIVPVDLRALATILDLAEFGLARADQAATASARAMVEQVRALLTGVADEPGLDSAPTPEGGTN